MSEELASLVNDRVRVLRPRLLDTTRRNPLINNVLSSRAASYVAIVDEKPQSILDLLVAERTMAIVPLPPMDDSDLPDEKNAEFRNAFSNAQQLDEDYLQAIERIDFDFDERAFEKQAKLDRALKDKIRVELDMPPRPGGTQHQDLVTHARIHGINPSTVLPEASFTADDDRHDDNDLQTLMLPQQLQSRLGRIYSKQRMFEEERGLKVTYLALGYLRWTLPDSPADDTSFKSPLFLIPVTLIRDRSTEGERYFIRMEGEPHLNPVLKQKLEADAQFDIEPLLKAESEDPVNVEGLFRVVQDFRPQRSRVWEVRREATFGVYPFQGIDLYNDLSPEGISFADFSVLKQLFLGSSESEEGGAGWETIDLDAEDVARQVPHTVLDSDSSQFLALLKVASGENVALEGPPGSGKSQTIVNAIANTLHAGKRVLFVAQKMTALEVVHARLQALGLHDFVLPMVGSKSDTESFYETLERRLGSNAQQQTKQLDTLRTQLQQQKEEISSYIQLLKRVLEPTSITVHELMGLKVRHSQAIDRLPPALRRAEISFHQFSSSFGLAEFSLMAQELAAAAEQLMEARLPLDSPWSIAAQDTLDLEALNTAMQDAQGFLDRLLEMVSSLEVRSLQHLNVPFEQHSATEIKKALELGKHWRNSTDLNWQRLVSNGDDARVLIQSLLQKSLYIDELAAKTSISRSQLEAASNDVSELRNLASYVAMHGLRAFGSEQPESLDARDRALLEKAGLASEAIDRLQSESLLVAPKKFSEVAEVVQRLASNSWVLTELERGSPADLLDQLDKAESLIGQAYGTLDESVPLPELKSLRHALRVIESSGFVARFGSAFKEAKKKASVWLGYQSGERINRSAVAADLEAVIDVRRKLADLRVSENLEELSSQSRIKVRDLRAALAKDFEQLLSCGFEARKAGAFASRAEVSTVLNLVAGGPELEAWGELNSRIGSLKARVDFYEKHADSIITAFKLSSSLRLDTEVLLSGLIDAANSYASVRAEMSDAWGRSNSDSPLPGEEQLKDYGELLSFTSSLSEEALELSVVGADSERRVEFSALTAAHLAVENTLRLLYQGVGRELKYRPAVDAETELTRFLDDRSGFNNLVARRNTLRKAASQGYGPALVALDEEGLLEQAEEYAPAALAGSLSRKASVKFGSSLMEFSGASLSASRAKLADLDRQLIELAPESVRLKSISLAHPPKGVGSGRKSEYTDLALIRHELGKTRRIPPRRLLKRARSALAELFPCWMMVPSSVAQHLPRAEMFDLVIIDEASQMLPEQSISALMRGRQALISGDTNQLPPSNFFQGLSVDDEDDEDTATPEESILELANTQFHPKHRLQWHYRSRHEELIAFSNHYVYDDELVIFPSPAPDRPSMGVSLVQVNGIFQRGLNPAEAQVMVEHVVSFMRQEPDRSLGVVVMNQAQMEQIDAMVLRAAQEDSAVADYIDRWADQDGGLQRFFVKNLENVQGDERDVIFIGTVYGADPTGRFYQRFGPINGPAGKRRLNVLFSRAKERIVTFSSIPLEKFSPNESNQGATLLKLWLQYSATKRLGERLLDSEQAGLPDNPFEEHVIETVNRLGFEAVPQVGVSGYYIDIGVKHPSYPFGYLCGIECDGASYHSAKTARDRDRLRQEVLERLGWSLYRIWSTDWFRDTFGQVELLEAHLNDLLKRRLEDVGELEHPFESTKPVVGQGSEAPLFREVTGFGNVEEVPHGEASEEAVIGIGSKVKIRYLSGSRAGATAQVWLTERADLEGLKMPGFQLLPVKAPLGQALIDSFVGDIVSFEVQGSVVRVEILEDQSEG